MNDPKQTDKKDMRHSQCSVLFLLYTQCFRFTQFLIYAEILTLALLFFSYAFPLPLAQLFQSGSPAAAHVSTHSDSATSHNEKKEFIHWVDFTVTNEALRQALRLDVDSYTTDYHLNWIELLAYLAARYGGDFSRYKASDMDTLAEKLKSGATMASLTDGMKYYAYYLEAYTAVLGGMVGVYEIQEPVAQNINDDSASGSASGSASDAGPGTAPGADPDAAHNSALGSRTPAYRWVRKYGLKAFSPIAKNFPYQDFDDFGAARSYGFKRQHLGHDMMGQVGTPIIAVESGYVEAIGWDQYGGWRLGIRSFDKKRYYYYAHLRKNYPYHKSLKAGSIVQAGDVIGYLGRTGYSRTENTNNIEEPHLHFGMQLIFDESQKDGNHEIWINCYEIVKFLQLNRSETVKNPETREYSRVLDMKDPAVSGGV